VSGVLDSVAVSAVILAGGAASRLGRDKALEEVGGKPMLTRVVDAVRLIATEIVIVGDSSGRQHLDLPEIVRWTTDRYPGSRGPLAGLHAGAKESTNDLLLAVGCDMPFLNPIVLGMLVRAGASGFAEAVVPRIDGRAQPLHAVYRRDPVIERAEQLLESDGRTGIQDLIRRLRAQYFGEEDVTPFDPDLRSFWSVNTADDLEHVRPIAGGGE
jgi:molybdopterin-guanine dinucleotide biosynthesis protein A